MEESDGDCLERGGDAVLFKENRIADAHLIVYLLFCLRQLNKLLKNISFLFQFDTLRPVVKRARDVDLTRRVIPTVEKSC